MKRSSIVFDLDGTLIDSAAEIQGIANRVLDREGVEPLSLEEARGFVGNGVPTFVKRAREARGIPPQRQAPMVEAFVEAYQTAFASTELYSGVRDALQDLHGRYALGICTNKVASATHAVLRHFEIDGFFDCVIGGDSLPTRKPDPEMLYAAFDALNGKHRVYVGDSEIDAETAERAGVPFLLFSEGYRRSPVAQIRYHGVFDHHADLASLIGKTLES